MINLIPDDIKEATGYAYRNKHLIRWCFACLVALAGIGVLMIFGQIHIANSEGALQDSIRDTEERIATNQLAKDQTELESLASGLKTIVLILQKQVLFSQLIPQIGTVLPDGSLLSSINIGSTDAAVSLEVSMRNASIAPIVQANLQNSENEIFDNADIESIDCADPTTAATSPLAASYPCSLSIRALFKSDSRFYFLNSVISTETP